MDGFDRLRPALRYQIANGLGWAELRPVQEQTIHRVLDGQNCVVLAPTAGGKTEAALFPLLSLMDEEDRAPVSALYIAPIRALLNNQEPRLQQLAALVGRRAFKWHGDVGQSARRRFIEDPADILAITPESLEAMLVSSTVPARRILANLHAVVIDEVHSFAAGDRGGHLAAVLERIGRIAGRDLQRIGLSATVGNPAAICEWLSGSSRRERAVVQLGGASAPPRLALDYVGNLENAAIVIERLHRGRKRLVFADSRRRVEALGSDLARRGVETHVSHSSLAASERHAAERAFEQGESCVIVATSALELGIDVGDLDHVLQIDAPATVSSFLQRMGRTGRRAGSVANCTFLATKDEALLQAAALLRLYARGYVEPVDPVRRGAHLLAHQIMALSLQHRGVPRGEWWGWVAGAGPFAGLDRADRDELLEHMLAKEILADVDGRLILGDRGQKLYGGRNFMELYAVFSAPTELKVMYGPKEVGAIDAYFTQFKEPGELTFVLAGKPWQTTHVDWRRGICYVEPALDAGLPAWMGAPRLLSYELCQAMREILVEQDTDPAWSARASDAIEALRAEHAFLHDAPAPLLDEGARIKWWTFAGGKANNVLARLLEWKLGSTITANNIAITFADQAASSEAGIRTALRSLAEEGGIDQETAQRFARTCARGRISKFQPCLPERLELQLLADALMDVENARKVGAGMTTSA